MCSPLPPDLKLAFYSRLRPAAPAGDAPQHLDREPIRPVRDARPAWQRVPIAVAWATPENVGEIGRLSTLASSDGVCDPGASDGTELPGVLASEN